MAGEMPGGETGHILWNDWVRPDDRVTRETSHRADRQPLSGLSRTLPAVSADRLTVRIERRRSPTYCAADRRGQAVEWRGS
jgi:hypothetical protein